MFTRPVGIAGLAFLTILTLIAATNAATVTGSFDKTYVYANNTTHYINLPHLDSVSDAYVEFNVGSKVNKFIFNSALTEYAQYKIKINGDTWRLYNVTEGLEATLTDTDFWNHVKPDGEDIRVYNQSAQLYFWVEEWDYSNQNAVIWVKVEAGSTELNIAYGNPSATKSAYDDPSMVFEFFDDFEDGDYTDKWVLDSPEGGFAVAEAEGVLKITATKLGSLFVKDFTSSNDNPIVVEYKWKPVKNDNQHLTGIVWHSADVANWSSLGYYRAYVYEGNFKIRYTSENLASTPYSVTLGEWIKVTLKIKGNGQFEVCLGTTCLEVQDTRKTLGMLGLGGGISSASEIEAHYDDFRIYKLADPADVVSVEHMSSSSVSVANPKLYLNNNLAAAYNGEINNTSGKIPIADYWNAGNNTLYFIADSENFDARITFNYTLNIAETKNETFEYVEINTSFYIPHGTTTATWQTSLTTPYQYAIKVYVNEWETSNYTVTTSTSGGENKTVTISVPLNVTGYVTVRVNLTFTTSIINVTVLSELNQTRLENITVQLLDKNFNLIIQGETDNDGSVTLETIYYGESYIRAKDVNGIVRQVEVYVPAGGTVNATIYFPTSEVIVATFQIVDYTNQFTHGDVIIKKYIGRGKLVKIDQQKVTVERKTSHYLIISEPYQIYITNGEETRSLGYISLPTSDTITLVVDSALNFPPIKYSSVIYNVTFEDGILTVQYDTYAGITSSVELWIYNSSGQLVYYANSTTERGKFIYLGDANETYTVHFKAQNSYEPVEFKVSVGTGGLSVQVDITKIKQLPDWFKTMFFGGLCMFVAILFKRSHVPVGLMLSFTLAATFTYLGILSLNAGVLWILAILVGLSFLAWWRERK